MTLDRTGDEIDPDEPLEPPPHDPRCRDGWRPMTGQLRMSEADWQARVIAYATLQGWRVAHFRPARTHRGWATPMTGDAGFPDLVFARDGVVLLAELKSNTGRIMPAQSDWLTALGAHGRLWRPTDWDTVITELSAPAQRRPA